MSGRSISVLALALALAPAAHAQSRPTVPAADYGRFETLGAFSLDPTGRWLIAAVRRVDESEELRIHPAEGNGESIVLEHASAPALSADGRWVAYRKGVSPERRKAAKKPIHDQMGLLDLASRTDTVLFETTTFSFRDDGAWLAVRGYPLTDTVGADLIVMNPANGARTVIGNVEHYAWQPDGLLLAVTLRTSLGDANGVMVFDPEAGTLRTLDSRDARYRALTWSEDSGRLAVLRSVERPDRAEASHDLLVWPDLDGAPSILAAAGRADLPDSLRVTEHAGIEFSADGRLVFVGLRPWEHVTAPDTTARPDSTAEVGAAAVQAANVQVWHWDDDQILRAQEYNAERISHETFLASWDTERKHLAILGDDLDEPVRLLEGGERALVPDYTPYRVQRRFGDDSADWYRIDLHTGARTLIAEAVRGGIQTGPPLAPVLFYQEDRWVALDLETLQRTTLGDGRSFTRSLLDYDFPGPRPSWGVAGWIEDRPEVLLYDKHDVWRANVQDGTLDRLTRGAEENRQYRVVRMDPNLAFGDPNVLSADEPIWLSAIDLRSKESGYAQITPEGRFRTLVFEDARVASLTKAGDRDRYALRMERWDDAPDVFVGGPDLSPLRQVSALNPFQVEYAWGRTELLDYTTDAGHELQAVLVYPADFEEGKQYPLILYQYERLSDGLHRYYTPSERSYYNYQVWSQQGYFVLMPDIVYEPGRPGPSALDAVEHALDAAVATGHVDAAHMGLIGHSWGGYQAAYLPTRTHRFAASVAGAAITNFMSFMGAIHWNGGLPESGHWETGQARMAVPYWEDVQGHMESSPANFITELSTPLLLMHGDADGTVDFRQGLEFYNYARRAGKEVVLLVYPGADHGLREETQQVDYHRRILQWFGHYLKGEPSPDWVERGETWGERGRRLGG